MTSQPARSRLATAFLFFLASLLFRCTFAYADTIVLKSGEVLSTVIDRFSDGAFWVREGKRTFILKPEEILKIVFTPEDPAPSAKPRVSTSPVKSPAASAALLSIPSAEASAEGNVADGRPDTAASDIAILNYRATMNHGIFQVVGEAENRGGREERYVKVSVFLLNAAGDAVDQNFSYVAPDPPHLAPGRKKQFRVSFLNPPSAVSKYRIRVESSRF